MKHYSPQLLYALKIASYVQDDKKEHQTSKDERKDVQKTQPVSSVLFRLNKNSVSQSNLFPKSHASPSQQLKFKMFEPQFERAVKSQSANRISTKTNKKPVLYHVERGNNSQLIRYFLQRRIWLLETNVPEKAHFRWKPTSHGIDFSVLGKDGKSVVNHFEFHREITTKSRLFHNLSALAKFKRINLDQIIPQTFVIRLCGKDFKEDFSAFEKYFNSRKEKQGIPQMYFFKPPDLNRGQGIQIFTELSQLQGYFRDYIVKKTEKNAQHQLKSSKSPRQDHRSIYYPHMQSTSQRQLEIDSLSYGEVVVQQYVNDLLLINQRKFDFRVWVMVDHQANLYWFKEGYLRLSSEVFSLTKSTKNLFVHLTNNAIQKNHAQYGKLEQGNQMGFSDFDKYLKSKGFSDNLHKDIIPQMKGQIKFALQACYAKMDALKRQCCFEIFGFDFVVTNEFQVLLIEVNTNPCLEESSTVLRLLLRRMINDALRLTVDIMFPTFHEQKHIVARDIQNETALLQYSNLENLWEPLGNLST